MKIYLISQDLNDDYDTYDSAVVIAKNEEDARTIAPSHYVTHVKNEQWMGTYSGGELKGSEYKRSSNDWIDYKDIDQLKVEYIGEAGKDQVRGVVLSSFNAG